jgi:DNA-binding NarL/FixJ family response regulator
VVVIPSPPSASALRVNRTDPIEALIIDRQPLFLAALGRLLAAPPVAYHVVTASRSDVGLEMARSGSVDLVCCDLYAEPISGLELLRIMTEERPDVPIILLGDVGDEVRLAAAIGSNVAGLFTKSSDPDEFLAGLRAVVSGHRAIGSGVIGQLLARYVSPNVQEPKRFGNQLSPTELEILAMIAQAQSISVIAASRGISRKTVRNHLAKIYRKLELHGRTEAMLWAARQGLIPGEVQ